MFKNFFKVALRNLLRNKAFSIINISGLAIGMAGAILILLWIQNELSYDQFHENKDRIYEAWNCYSVEGKLECSPLTPKILGTTLKQEYPEIQSISRFNQGGNVFTAGEKKLRASGAIIDPEFLTMFSFPLLKGNVKTALAGVYSIVITEKFAKKLFGDDDPMNKTIRVIDRNDNFIVTGVLKDLPNNTQFNFEYLLPWEYMKKLGWDDNAWSNNSISTFIEVKPGISETFFNDKIKNVTKQHSNGEENTAVFVHPISKWRLYSKFENGKIAGGRIEIVRLLGIIAGFILLIACINFMNLSTAGSEKRAKEVGIRKVVGAQKNSLIGQFLGESVLIAFLAGILALIMAQLCLPSFNLLTEKNLSVSYNSPWFWLAGLSFVLFTGIISGSYPAFYLSSFQPVRVLKGAFKKVNVLVTPRKLLVVVQFTFAIILTIATFIVRQQIQYAQERQPGYEKNNLIYLDISEDINKNYSLIKNDLLSSGAATAVCKTSSPLTESWSNGWEFDWQGKNPDDKITFNTLRVDEDLVKTAGFKIMKGRDISISVFSTDSTACMLNESAAKAMGFIDPIGQTIKCNGVDWHVAGMVKDFIIGSPYQSVEPMVIQGSKSGFNAINIKLNSRSSPAQNLIKVEDIFKKYNPQYPFEVHFVDAVYAAKFKDELLTGTLAALFAGLTIFISCLGLFGLATYMAESRIKEIGIRKVLGASVTNITTLLSKDFLKLIIVSLVIASPVSWYAMNHWLQDFPYRIHVEWWVFAAAGILAIFIAIVTVSFQAIKAAIANPVKSLRTE